MSSTRVALYARVSSETQCEAGTIQSQVAEILARARADGEEIPEDLRFLDDGYSGASLLRPALEHLRDLVAAGMIDRVYVHSPDRLARRYAYQVLLVDEFARANAEIRFLNHEVGSSPEDALLLQVQGMIAEYERAKIMERSRRGKRHAAQCGLLHVFGAAPFGYRYVSKQEGGGVARWDLVLEESRLVQRMFERVAVDRASINEVCRMLREEHAPTRKAQGRWGRNTVWNMLKNPAYKGMAVFGRTRKGPVRHRLRPRRGSSGFPKRGKSVYPVDPAEWIHVPVPRIVSDELFAAVQEQLVENRDRVRRRWAASRWLLAGLVVCRQCGYAAYGKTASTTGPRGRRYRNRYYRCPSTDAYRGGGTASCTMRMVRADQLEEAVWQEVRRLIEDPQRVQAEYERRASESSPRGEEEIQVRIRRLQQGIQRLIDGYAEGLLDKGEFEPRLRDRKQRLAQLEEEATRIRDAETTRQQLRLVVGRIETFARQVEAGLGEMAWTQRRDLVRTLVKHVQIDHEEITVTFRVDPIPVAHEAKDDVAVVQHCPTRFAARPRTSSRHERASDAGRPASATARGPRAHGPTSGLGGATGLVGPPGFGPGTRDYESPGFGGRTRMESPSAGGDEGRFG